MKRFLVLLVAVCFIATVAYAQGTPAPAPAANPAPTCDQIKQKKDTLKAEMKAATDTKVKKEKKQELKALKAEWKKAGCKKKK